MEKTELVRGPSKFEGERLYVPYLWARYLDGAADDDDGIIVTFEISETEKAHFPELADRDIVRLVEDEYGFVFEV